MDVSLMKKESCRAWGLSIVSALAGVIAWSGSMPAIALAIFMPIAVSLQGTRRHAFITAAAYYIGSTWPILPGAKAFFGANVTWIESATLWLTSSLLLAIPFGLLWTKTIRLRRFGIVCALLVISLPPVGLVGWASPLTAAGVLFPGTAWLGLASIAFFCAFCSRGPRLAAGTAGILLLLAQSTYRQPVSPPSWQGVNTNFGSGFSVASPLMEFQSSEAVQCIARESLSKVLIFPEMVINRWNDATASFWEPTLFRLRQADKTIVIGAGLPIPGQSRSYLNAAIILGRHPSPPFIQRIPVPIAMWKPFSTTEGVPLRFLGSGTTVVAGQRSAILICYEQLLTWPYIASALEQPGILIGIANDYWATGTSIPAAQNACLQAWSRLFGIPYISATNT